MIHPDCLNEADVRQMEPLRLLRLLGGYYETRRDADGTRHSPLVGYAGKYKAADGSMKQYVGDVYANFAQAERRPFVIMAWASMMKDSLQVLEPTVVMGMPMGGIVSAFTWAYVCGCEFVFPERKIQALATKDQREQAILAMARHELHTDDRVIIGEDVCNNFSTTDQAIELVEKAGAKVVGISCWLNRSKHLHWWDIPIKPLVHRILPEYKQEDEFVAADIAAGNIVWKPKDEWDRLMAGMNA